MDASVLADLANQLRGYLASQFASGSSEVLAFEPFGVPVDPNTFRSGPQGNFNTVLVAGYLTRLTDKVGQLVGDQFHRRWKAHELFGALMEATVSDANELAAFGAIKGPAEQAFRAATPTYVTNAMPDDWYDPSVAGNWTAGHSFISHQGGQTPEVPDPNDNWKLRLVAVHDQPILGSLGRPSAVLSLAPAESIVANTAAVPGRPLGELLTLPTTIDTSPLLSGKQPLFAKAVPVNPDLTASTRASASASKVATGAPAESAGSAVREVTVSPIVPLSANLLDPTAAPHIAAVPAGRISRPVGDILLDPDLTVGLLAGVDSRAADHPISSSSLTLSFDLCPVSLDRDWWSWMLIRTRGWTIPLSTSGELVPGLPADGATAIPPPCGLPSTMLLIRNLQISGWSDEDLGVLGQASSLGPFSFAGGTQVISRSLTAPGMQVIGWVCELLPPLPPPAAASSPPNPAPASSPNPSNPVTGP